MISVIFSWKGSVLDFGLQGEFALGEMHGHGIMTEADGTKKELQPSWHCAYRGGIYFLHFPTWKFFMPIHTISYQF
jgi:hypothetical protein